MYNKTTNNKYYITPITSNTTNWKTPPPPQFHIDRN